MKLLRITGLTLFLLSAMAFAGYRWYESNSRDTAGAVITCNTNSINVSVKTSGEEFLQGVTAFDEKDGDVTDSVLIEKVSRFTVIGKRIITYAAFDLSNNITKAERKLVYTDYTSPRFSLTKPLHFIVGETDSIIEYMTVQDCIDGNLANKIKYEAEDENFGQVEGTYKIEFQVMNSAGDIAYLPVEVEFYYPSYQNNELIPEILLREYIIYIKTGESIDTKSYLTGVILGPEEYSFREAQPYGDSVKTMSMNLVKVKSNLNSKTPGVYTIEYSLTTEEGYTGTTKLLVVVEE